MSPKAKTPKAKPASKKKRQRGSDLHPRVMISGYYGFDNLGDELILRVLVDELKKNDVKITVLSQNPKKTAETYGVDAIHRTNIIDIIDALAQTNLFISGGGGLFQDITGPMSTVYYGGLILLAGFFEVPVCFWAQGVGPLNSNLGQRMTRRALRRCEEITVRDEASAGRVEGMIGERPEVTGDPVWLLNLPKKKTPASKANTPWRIGISLRPWPALTQERLNRLAEALSQMVSGSTRPVEFMLLPFQAKEDTELLSQFAEHLDNHKAGPHVFVKPEEVLERISDCDVLFGMRFHSLILAMLADVAVYGLVYDPKVEALLDQFHLKGTPVDALEQLDPAEIQAYFNAYPGVNLKPLKKLSKRNFEVLNRLLAIPDAELVL